MGAAIAFFGVGFAMVLYELARIKAGRTIMKGGVAAQGYYMIYLAMFVLAFITALKVVIG